MLSSVLRSKKAVEMNIFIIRAFIKLRELLASNRELADKISSIEKKLKGQDSKIETIQIILGRLLADPTPSKGKIGFDNTP